jgi:protein phosphatase 1 regulatory subunit 7
MFTRTSQTLEELWMSSALISSYDDLEPLTTLASLSCLYLEHNPLASDFEYRMRVTKMLPSLVQLDADIVRRA